MWMEIALGILAAFAAIWVLRLVVCWLFFGMVLTQANEELKKGQDYLTSRKADPPMPEPNSEKPDGINERLPNPEVSLDTYALYPIYEMVHEGAPFNDWKPSKTKITAGLEETFKIYVWMYQVYVFYLLTAKRFGYEIAENVLRLQVEKISSISEELGGQLKIAIHQIHRNMVYQTEEPFKLEIKPYTAQLFRDYGKVGDKVNMPVEWGLALECLTTVKDSAFPLQETREKLKREPIPEFDDAVIALAECLEHGKTSAHSYFAPVVQELKVVL